MKIFQCVPNISEGRDLDFIISIADNIKKIKDVNLLDYSSDVDHNRSVFTLLGQAEGLKEAIRVLYDSCLQRIDMRKHTGAHPRIGAVDVVPFVPILETTMDEADLLCKSVARHIAEKYDVPIYLYGHSAKDKDRSELPTLRKGGFEALQDKDLLSIDRAPDLGPNFVHPTLGASCFGARGPLVAFNVILRTNDVEIAKRIAAKVRNSSGGLRCVKALGIYLASQDKAQVSMNLTDTRMTSVYTAFEMVKMEALRYGVGIEKSELIGAISLESICDSLSYYLQLPELKADRVIERGIVDLLK